MRVRPTLVPVASGTLKTHDTEDAVAVSVLPILVVVAIGSSKSHEAGAAGR